MEKEKKKKLLQVEKLFLNDGEFYQLIDMVGHHAVLRRYKYKEKYGYEAQDHYVNAEDLKNSEYWKEVSIQ